MQDYWPSNLLRWLIHAQSSQGSIFFSANIKLPDFTNFHLREVKWIINGVWITTKFDFLHTIVLGYLFVCLENKFLYAWGFTKNPQYSLQIAQPNKNENHLKIAFIGQKYFIRNWKHHTPSPAQPSWHCGFQIEIENRNEWPKVIGKATMGWEAASTWGLYSTKVG